MRRGGLVAIDYGKKNNEKEHEVTYGGIVDPIQTDVNLTKTTFFGAAASRFVSAELLLDSEKGTREQTIKHPTKGTRTSDDAASSNYMGGMFDFRFFGVSFAKAGYDFKNEFKVGEIPDLSKHDEIEELSYTNFKLGSAIKIGVIRVGAYVLNQKASGDFSYTYYNPADGTKGSTEKTSVSRSAKGYGAGIGMTLPNFRTEASLEKMYDNELDYDKDYPAELKEIKDASRITALAEAHIKFFSIGFRFRSIKGNYVDLEDIISTNLLYDNMGPDDTRTETSFNFSLGDSKGFSPSIFYTQSTVETNEEEPVFDSGEKFKAKTKSKAYGVNLTYRF